MVMACYFKVRMPNSSLCQTKISKNSLNKSQGSLFCKIVNPWLNLILEQLSIHLPFSLIILETLSTFVSFVIST